jgi:hypothetical protein
LASAASTTATGYSDTLGSLAITANSSITLGNTAHTLTFSSLNVTGTPSLTINGWQGMAGSNGTYGEIIFTGYGSSPLAANNTFSTFLSNVSFTSFTMGAEFVTNGSNIELVPAATPEPTHLLLLAAGSLLAGCAVRRRLWKSAIRVAG